jgi:hypothetical protein
MRNFQPLVLNSNDRTVLALSLNSQTMSNLSGGEPAYFLSVVSCGTNHRTCGAHCCPINSTIQTVCQQGCTYELTCTYRSNEICDAF